MPGIFSKSEESLEFLKFDFSRINFYGVFIKRIIYLYVISKLSTPTL